MPKEEKKHKRPQPVVVEEIVDTDTSSAEESALTEVEDKASTERPIDHPVHTYPTTDESTPIAPTPEVEAPKAGFHINVSFVFITLAVAFFVAILSGALYVYFNGVQSLKVVTSSPTPLASVEPSSEPEATPAVSNAPTATPKALNTYTISILNGSGRIGEASKVKALLEKSGFKVGKTGNADSFNYPDTLIQVKESVPADVITKAQDAIKASYVVKKGDNLDAKSSFDIIITIGAK